jgi:dienelactone hydrolase
VLIRRAMSRRAFLVLGGIGFAGAVFSSVAGCGGEGEGNSRVTMTSEPDNAEDSRQTAEISTPRGTVRGVLYPVEGARAAAVMVGGAGGDNTGPADIYDELATRLRDGGAEVLRLEYRTPNQLDECVYDLLAGIEALGQRGIERVVLVGWSFGGAVVISAGAESDDVVGVATVASQSYGAEAVGELSPEKSLLLIHGTADRVLPYELSERLYAQAGEPKELVLYPDDGHGVERHRSEMLEKLHGWSRELLLDGSETRPEEG